MTRYIRRPLRASIWQAPVDEEFKDSKAPSLTVFESENAVDTGIVDTDETPIYRDDRVPIGFLGSWRD